MSMRAPSASAARARGARREHAAPTGSVHTHTACMIARPPSPRGPGKPRSERAPQQHHEAHGAQQHASSTLEQYISSALER